MGTCFSYLSQVLLAALISRLNEINRNRGTDLLCIYRGLKEVGADKYPPCNAGNTSSVPHLEDPTCFLTIEPVP